LKENSEENKRRKLCNKKACRRGKPRERKALSGKPSDGSYEERKGENLD
jgi:hypothetical protein